MLRAPRHGFYNEPHPHPQPARDIKVEFWSREPGEHIKLHEVFLPDVPREGESVTLSPLEEAGRYVHSVSWLPLEHRAIVLLTPLGD